MNPNSRASISQEGSVFLNNYHFDFGLPSSSRSSGSSLNDQKNQRSDSYPSFSPSHSTEPLSKPVSAKSWSTQKSSWIHQQAPHQISISSIGTPSSMVGDLSGKSWTAVVSSSRNSHLGLAESDPNLFGDLLGTALGQPDKSANVPLKNASRSRNSSSVGNLSESHRQSSSVKTNNGGQSHYPVNFSSFAKGNNITRTNSVESRVTTGSAPKGGINDPFEFLVDFRSKAQPSASKISSISTDNHFSFGAPESTYMQQGNTPEVHSNRLSDLSSRGCSPHNPLSEVSDPLDVLFSSSSAASDICAKQTGDPALPESSDWDFGPEFSGNDYGGTAELDSLPSPPSGISGSTAQSRGIGSYKQGQFADAIKWLSWARTLLKNYGDTATLIEVLSLRASCYKEMGEYKKAIADCSLILENDSRNVSVLLQRALLYESSEKYKLGADDLRTVLKIDPSNRLAKGTIHRLTKLSCS